MTPEPDPAQVKALRQAQAEIDHYRDKLAAAERRRQDVLAEIVGVRVGDVVEWSPAGDHLDQWEPAIIRSVTIRGPWAGVDANKVTSLRVSTMGARGWRNAQRFAELREIRKPTHPDHRDSIDCEDR